MVWGVANRQRLSCDSTTRASPSHGRAAPAVTFHARPSWSLRWWDRAPTEAHAELLGAARPWLGDARVVESRLKRWRFATPQTIWPERCWSATDVAAPLVLAGDAFGGPRVEGAALSGLAAAQSLIEGPR